MLSGLFLLWVLVSLSVYGYRIWRRIAQGPKAVRQAEAGSAPAPATGLAPTASFASTMPSGPAAAAAPVSPPAEGPAGERSRPAVPFAAMPANPPASAAPASASGRGGMFAGSSPVAPAPPRDGAATPVAEALAGIQMPCDLVPLMSADGSLDPYHVDFVTTGVPAPTVGAALGDELERLGFSLTTTSEIQVVATKPGVQVTVTLVPDAAAVVDDGKNRRYPTVPPGSVVVDFRS